MEKERLSKIIKSHEGLYYVYLGEAKDALKPSARNVLFRPILEETVYSMKEDQFYGTVMNGREKVPRFEDVDTSLSIEEFKKELLNKMEAEKKQVVDMERKQPILKNFVVSEMKPAYVFILLCPFVVFFGSLFYEYEWDRHHAMDRSISLFFILQTYMWCHLVYCSCKSLKVIASARALDQLNKWARESRYAMIAAGVISIFITIAFCFYFDLRTVHIWIISIYVLAMVISVGFGWWSGDMLPIRKWENGKVVKKTHKPVSRIKGHAAHSSSSNVSVGIASGIAAASAYSILSSSDDKESQEEDYEDFLLYSEDSGYFSDSGSGFSSSTSSRSSHGSSFKMDNAPWEKYNREQDRYHSWACEHDDPYDCDNDDCY